MVNKTTNSTLLRILLSRFRNDSRPTAARIYIVCCLNSAFTVHTVFIALAFLLIIDFRNNFCAFVVSFITAFRIVFDPEYSF